MAAQDPQSILVGSPLTPLPREDRDLLPNPSGPQSEADSTAGQNTGRNNGDLATSTNPTTLASPVIQDKSAPTSLNDHPPPPPPRQYPGRMPSVSLSAYEPGGGPGRYPSITRPRPVLATQDPNVTMSRRQSGLEWIVPNAGGNVNAMAQKTEKTVAERLEPTLVFARRDRDQYTSKGRFQNIIINGAIGLQVIAGALTTGVAAATTGKSTSIGVSILGGLSTVLASYLAKARGSGEPEYSQLRARELETFIREVEAWTMDYGHLTGSEYDERINMFRQRFETIIRTEGEDSSNSMTAHNMQSNVTASGKVIEKV